MQKVELVLRNAEYLDSQKKAFVKGDIAIDKGKIVGINGDFIGKEERDLEGETIVPGFIDGHIHLESSIISPFNFSKIVSLHGTTSVITDPHEISNILGRDGVEYMLQATENLPIDVQFMIPSCVPATPLDESGAVLDSNGVEEILNLNNKRIIGLAEMMNYPGVIFQDEEVMKKIKMTLERKMRVDGHAPGLTGEDLEKYISAGISSDHECSSEKEAIEKLEVAKELGKDFYIMIREGTAARNFYNLKGLFKHPEYIDNLLFATDDKHPEELRSKGHIDHIIRKAIKAGINLEDAYIVATTNAAKYFGLADVGSIEVGKKADLVVLKDKEKVKIDVVYKDGEEITTEKLQKWEEPKIEEELNKKVRNTINLPREVTLEDIDNKGIPNQVIGLVPFQLITEDVGAAKDYDLENDIIKVVVIESHKGTMHMSTAFLKGMGLKNGAVGTTVAHDSHYLIAAGTNDKDIVTAVNEIRKMQGGKIYVENGKVEASLPLHIAGLMTELDPKDVISSIENLKEKAPTNEGIDPFMNLSFLSLGVIPNMRILPGGVFDVNKWRFVNQEEINKKWEEQQKDNTWINHFDDSNR